MRVIVPPVADTSSVQVVTANVAVMFIGCVTNTGSSGSVPLASPPQLTKWYDGSADA